MRKEEIKKYSSFQNSFYMLKNIKNVVPLAFWLIFAIIPFGVLGPFFSIYLPKVLITGIERNLDPIEIIKSISIVVLLLIFCNVITSIIDSVQYALGIDMRSYFSYKEYQEKLMDIDYSYLVTEDGMIEQSKVLHVVYTGDGSFLHQFAKETGGFLISISGIIFYGGLIYSINSWLILMIFAGATINLIYGKYNSNYRYKSTERRSKDTKRLEYITTKTGDFRFAKDMRLFEMKTWFMDNFRYYLSSWSKEYKKQIKINTLGGIIDALIVFLRDGLAYFFLLGLFFSRKIKISDFVLLLGAVVGFSGWLSSIVKQINNYGIYSIDINIMREFFEKEDRLNRKDNQYKANLNKALSIEFKDISFKYKNSDNYVLKNFNLQIKPGEKIALVGVNGAGKTTIVSLLMGLLEPIEGEILVDGVSQEDYNIYDYYSMFSTVFQDIYIMPDTILNNITSGEENHNYEKVNKVLEQVGLFNFVNGLEDKENTYLVRASRKNAIDLSGGQNQRLLLARALYKDAPINILDEPTAALDPIAESEIYEAYNEITKNKTSIFISHRLSSTKFCDRILFLENGEILEEGSHEELMEANAKYREMFDIQSHYYKEDVGGVVNG